MLAQRHAQQVHRHAPATLARAEYPRHRVLHIRLPGLDLPARHLHHQEMRIVVHVDLVGPRGVVHAPLARRQQRAPRRLPDLAAARQLQRDLVAGALGLVGLQPAAADALRAGMQLAHAQPRQFVIGHAAAKTPRVQRGHFQRHEGAADALLPAGAIQELLGRAAQQGLGHDGSGFTVSFELFLAPEIAPSIGDNPYGLPAMERVPLPPDPEPRALRAADGCHRNTRTAGIRAPPVPAPARAAPAPRRRSDAAARRRPRPACRAGSPPAAAPR